MVYEFKTQRIVEFAETDMAGIMHFSNYFRYMEATEHAFFRSLGMSVHTDSASGAWAAARRSAECKFHHPLRYEDVVELHLLVTEKRSRSISYVVLFNKQIPDVTGEGQPVLTEVARGTMTVVFVSKSPADGSLKAVPIPPKADALIEVAPATLLP